jgi:hypothetical protein
MPANSWRGAVTFLSGGDAYALRCAYLHEGGAGIGAQRARQTLDKFHFIVPPCDGNVVHCNQDNDTLQLQTDLFCADICDGAEAWIEVNANNVDIQERMKALVIIHPSNGFLPMIGFRR